MAISINKEYYKNKFYKMCGLEVENKTILSRFIGGILFLAKKNNS